LWGKRITGGKQEGGNKEGKGTVSLAKEPNPERKIEKPESDTHGEGVLLILLS